MSRPARTAVQAWWRVAAAVLTLAVLVWRLGTGPFVDGIRSVDASALAAGAAIAALTTTCYGWRWKIVARGLGVDLALRDAVAAYYRSIFLNVTLPGGIVGDVHRGVSHGRNVQDRSRALRSVAWERLAGQILQLLLAAVVLLVLPSPVRAFMPAVVAAAVVAVIAIVLVVRARPARRLGWVTADIRDGLLARSAWPGIALASALIICGHVTTFVIAARTAGTSAPASRILPLALIVILAMALPSVAGWGPREGVAAWAFGAAGLGAGRGVATGVVFGVMTLVASTPGAAVLAATWLHRNGPAQPARSLVRKRPARA